MFTALLCLTVIFAILISSEYLSRRKVLKKETLRKYVHVSVGVFIAFWPWIMSWRTIQIISLAFLVVVFISRQFNIFSALKSVKRKSYGDIFFALAVGICASITEEPVYFCIAILILAVADGFAALIGERYGGAWGYKVVKQHKTLIGSMAFWLLCLFILGVGLLFAADVFRYREYIAILVLLPPLLTFFENIMPFGSDNLALPLVTVSFLSIVGT